ncbi:hypothetical protein CapIbe_007223 [Capra ibex]
MCPFGLLSNPSPEACGLHPRCHGLEVQWTSLSSCQKKSSDPWPGLEHVGCPTVLPDHLPASHCSSEVPSTDVNIPIIIFRKAGKSSLSSLGNLMCLKCQEATNIFL